ncbi:unnamed protein product [Brassica oleracea]
MAINGGEARHRQRQRRYDGDRGVGGIVGMVIMAPLARRYPRALGSLSRTQFARDYSTFAAAACGIDSIMRVTRGKDDLTNHLVSGSGAGLAYSFVSQGFKVRPAHALLTAAGSAVVMSGTVYKGNEIIRSRNAQDSFYTEARAMLSKLSLEDYEKNFKKGHLTDYTLPLLTDSDLKEVNIPPGARLLILDHIKRFVHKSQASLLLHGSKI